MRTKTFIQICCIILLTIIFLSNTLYTYIEVLVDVDEYRFYGNVKSCSTVHYEPIVNADSISLGKLKVMDDYNTKAFYNKKHQLVNLCRWNFSETYLIKSFFEYDKSGKHLFTTVYDSYIVNEHYLNSNDTTGFELDYHSKYIYNKKGNLSENTVYSAKDNEVIYKNLYIYGKSDKPVSKSLYQNGQLTYIHRYSYNNKGLLIELCYYKSESELDFRETYSYDANGNKSTTCRFNTHGQLIYKTNYVYDEKGNIIDISNYSNNNTLLYHYSYVYEFDNYGNWTERQFYNNSKIDCITVREIEYY